MKRIGCLLLLLFLAGCLKLERQYPQRDSFVLDIGGDGPAVAAGIDAHLQVRRLELSPRFAGTGFYYRTGELTYEGDFYNRFLASPATLITEETRRWLTAAGLLDPPASRPGELADLVVEGEITALYGDFRARPQAVMEIRFNLLSARTARAEILLRRSYRQEIPLVENNPTALVEGWNQALRRILTEFEADLRQTVAR
ncbi:MAG: membrane integrity-associated transporter subunit PqiC [Desulfuromonadales bacterium]|nr:membrane integrity-associated transporter subunit PqiC [Desulfuromonadales bacterium]